MACSFALLRTGIAAIPDSVVRLRCAFAWEGCFVVGRIPHGLQSRATKVRLDARGMMCA
jgi:hypothetical protein